MKTYTMREAVEIINKLVLGTPAYGFEQEELWGDDFRNKYFNREGVIEGEEYSARVNQVLSGSAMSHTLDQIRLRLNQLVDADEGDGEQTTHHS